MTQKSLAKIAQITLMMLRDLILLAKMLARMEENFCTIESHKTVPFICRSNLLRLHYNVPYYFSKIRKKVQFWEVMEVKKKNSKNFVYLSIFAVIIKQIHIFIALFFQNQQSNLQSFSDAVEGVMESGIWPLANNLGRIWTQIFNKISQVKFWKINYQKKTTSPKICVHSFSHSQIQFRVCK